MSESRPAPRLNAYIDEAGDGGSKYGLGSSEFLVIGCAVFAAGDSSEVLRVFDETRVKRNHRRQIRKFSDSSDKDNFVLTKILSEKNLRVIQCALHKPSLGGSKIGNDPQLQYNYLVKFAVERISWLARDAARGGDPARNRCRLVFSEQRLYPYDQLREYLNKLQKKGPRICSAAWEFLDEHVVSVKHQNETPIHLADTIASALHRAIEPKHHEMVDDRFQRNLHLLIYRRNGKHLGIKLFPPQPFEERRRNGTFLFLDRLP